MNDKTVIVLIPIYKQQFNDEEEKNVRNNIRKLNYYDIAFIAPENLELKYYNYAFGHIKIYFFKDHYFKNLNGYNKLMLSSDFYKRFLRYQYICICQPDVWVIKSGDVLNEFCVKQIDYVGAPWCPEHSITILQDKLKICKAINLFLPKKKLYVGNGGFSLRNIRKSIYVLEKYKVLKSIWTQYEDYFFSYVGTYIEKEYKIAEVETAKRFALETDSERIMREELVIPIAVHAYRKYYPNLIEIEEQNEKEYYSTGYNDKSNLCNTYG